MDVLIEKLNGEQKRFSELGLIPRDFLVSTAGVREYGSQITGRPGKIDKGADYDAKTIDVPFMFESADLPSYSTKRDEIYAWLGGKEAFYIYEGRSEVITEFEVPGEKTGGWSYSTDVDTSKRYLVRRTNDLGPNQKGLWGLDSISLSTVELPFAESTAIKKLNFTDFSKVILWNDGTEVVDPEIGMELVIEFVGTSNGLTLRNEANDTEWNYSGTTTGNDAIKIDGIQSTKNQLSIVRYTNIEYVKLEPGRNIISVEGATAGVLSFSFREYYR